MTFWVLNIQNDQLALKKKKKKKKKPYIERARTQTKLYIVAYEACYIPLHYTVACNLTLCSCILNLSEKNDAILATQRSTDRILKQRNVYFFKLWVDRSNLFVI